ncbi:MAG: GAF domain-containing protein [Candidatus Eremiobacteraeota bacterium]|nr:GAF domain-containing protein [Candidatus Eremiobacteraeota bacterium]
MKLDQVQDLTKLVKTAVRTMANQYKAERVAINFESRPTAQPGGQATYGLEDNVWGEATVSQDILRTVMRTGRTVFTLDVTKDSKFKSEGATHPCVLCVPLLDVRGRALGFIYCDHSKAGAFDYKTREAAERLGRAFIARYQDLEPSGPPEPPAPIPKQSLVMSLEEARSMAKAVLYLVGFVLLVFTVWLALVS